MCTAYMWRERERERKSGRVGTWLDLSKTDRDYVASNKRKILHYVRHVVVSFNERVLSHFSRSTKRNLSRCPSFRCRMDSGSHIL
jgi:hypothetical protein